MQLKQGTKLGTNVCSMISDPLNSCFQTQVQELQSYGMPALHTAAAVLDISLPPGSKNWPTQSSRSNGPFFVFTAVTFLNNVLKPPRQSPASSTLTADICLGGLLMTAVPLRSPFRTARLLLGRSTAFAVLNCCCCKHTPTHTAAARKVLRPRQATAFL